MGTYPTENRKFQKNSKKIQKFRKNHHSFVSIQNRLGKATKERKGKKSFRWVSKRPEIENVEKTAKKFKKLENTIVASFRARIGWKRPRMREKKNCSDGFLPDPE